VLCVWDEALAGGKTILMPAIHGAIVWNSPRWSDFGMEETKSIKGTVDAILSQVLTSMKPRYKKEFGSVVHEQFINVEYEDGVPVIVV
jgi:hypothetical protein